MSEVVVKSENADVAVDDSKPGKKGASLCIKSAQVEAGRASLRANPEPGSDCLVILS